MEKEFRSYEMQGNTLVYYMPEEVDHHVSQQLCAEVDRLVAALTPKELILDFAKTEFMDSSGIGVVIGRSKTMHFREGTLSVCHLGERVNTIFRTAGLHKIVQIKEV